MKHLLFLSFFLFAGILCSHQFYEKGTFPLNIKNPSPSDTTVISNRAILSPGNTMTTQYALVVEPPSNSKLASIEIHYSSFTMGNGDSSRMFVKSDASWECPNLGSAEPLFIDSLTLGVTKNIAIKTGWNIYHFDEPIDVPFDTIYIWPDILQQLRPKWTFAQGNTNGINYMTGSTCAINFGDIACELTFVKKTDCPSFTSVTTIDSLCVSGDTILSSARIDSGKMVSFLSKSLCQFDPPFQIEKTSGIEVDMSGCD